MTPVGRHTLPKEERLSGKVAIDALVKGGKWLGTGHLKACVLQGNGAELNRMMVSVPKKNFKRAVKRNLLKRRIRESYRLQKHLINLSDTDILFVYNHTEVLDFDIIFSEIGEILSKIRK